MTTLARTTVLASSAGGTTKITLSGTSNVFVTYPAEIATMLGNPTATNGGIVYGTGTAINVSAVGTVSGYQFLQSAGAASPTWVQIPSFKDVAVAPSSPAPIEGDRFFDNTTGIEYDYITTASGNQWVETAPGNLASVAGGSNTQVQYNNNGVLSGITGATTNGTVLTLTTPVLGTPASGTVTNLTGTASININGTVGATTPSTGAFTTLDASGAATFNAGASTDISHLELIQTGVNGANFKITGDGATTPSKTIRVNAGVLQVINSAYSAAIFTLSDTGAVTMGAALTYGGVTLSNSVTGTGSMVLSTSPTLTTPVLGAATGTSLALGGATLGSNALAVTGASQFNAVVSAVNGRSVGDYQVLLEGGYNGYSAAVSLQSRTSSGGTLVEMGRISSDGESAWNTTGATQNAYMRFYTTAAGTSTERMRITSAGNLCIGNTSTSYKCAVSGILNVGTDAAGSGGNGQIVLNSANSTPTTSASPVIYHRQSVGLGLASDYAISFEVNGGTSRVEAARINTSGYLLEGCTASWTPPNSQAANYYSPNGMAIGTTTASSVVYAADRIVYGTTIATFYVLDGNGTGVKLTTGATSWATQSLREMKRDFSPITDPRSRIMGLRAELGRYKEDADDAVLRPFLFVEDAVESYPWAVGYDKEGAPDSLRMTDFIPLHTAGLQNLYAENEALKATIATLEARLAALEAK